MKEETRLRLEEKYRKKSEAYIKSLSDPAKAAQMGGGRRRGPGSMVGMGKPKDAADAQRLIDMLFACENAELTASGKKRERHRCCKEH